MPQSRFSRVFSCELCENLKNTFDHRIPLVAASGFSTVQDQDYIIKYFSETYSGLCQTFKWSFLQKQ